MEYAACNVVYVDRTAKEDRLVTRDDTLSTSTDQDSAPSLTESHALARRSQSFLDDNLRTLLGTFSEGSFPTLWQCDVEKANPSKCTYAPLADLA